MLAVLVFAIVGFAAQLAAALTTSCSSIDPRNRQECGYPGITPANCLSNANCCFDDTIDDVKWCFIDPSRNPCSSAPCKNGGTCKPTDGNTFTCQCPTGYSGSTCSSTPCSSSPCMNGGSCTVSGSSYTCQCATGYSGPTCTSTSTPCSPSPCKNGGACTVSGNSYTCQCAEGFSGTTCDVTPCSSSPCKNGGSCTLNGNTFSCSCAVGFSGTTCDITPCTSAPCQNAGTCTSLGSAFSCQCPAGYTGTICDTVIGATTTKPPTTPKPIRPPRPYTLNITVDDILKELYFDGVKYTGSMPNYGIYYIKDSASLAIQPNVIAVAGYDAGTLSGILASDSEGFLTDGSWKCTHQLFDNWFATDYDDSAWPAAKVLYANGNRTSTVNELYLANGLVKDISHRAYWIWSPVFDTKTRMAYCRFRLPAVDSCTYSPCKNGGACQNYNNAARFWCLCPAGFTGYDCSQKPVDYQFSVTADDYIRDVYIDGRKYDVPKELVWHDSGTLSLDYMPTVIAVSGSNSPVLLFGILGSDNAGRITDDSWKCSNVFSTEWMLVDFDDSNWDTANLGSINGDRMSPINYIYHANNPIDGISNAAYWIWPKVYDVKKNFAYCRVKLSHTGNACISSPCKNGGTCTNVGPTFKCSCPAGTSGDTCKIPGAVYQLNITGDDYLRDLYIDGVRYDTLYGASWSVKDTIQVDFLPAVVGVYVQCTAALFGILASDSAGYVTDGSWKCTKSLSNNWMFVGYDDSAWPAPLVMDINGNRTSNVNRLWHGLIPIENIAERAQWIWASDYNTTLLYNWVYCRLDIPPFGNACFSNPCKNGGTCTNKRTTFECACKSGFSGAQCTSPSTAYQLNVTVNDYLWGFYIDGVKYDVKNYLIWYLTGTINLDFAPRQISMYAYNGDTLYNGMLFSDSLGHVSDSSWKCTRYGYKDWMLVDYDDSAWPAAGLTDKNDNTAAINIWNGYKPIAGISNSAYWIWPKDYDKIYNYAYCRSPLFY